MKMVANMAENAPAADGTKPTAMTEQDKKIIKSMSSMNMQLVEALDVDQQGLAFDVKMTMQPRATQELAK